MNGIDVHEQHAWGEYCEHSHKSTRPLAFDRVTFFHSGRPMTSSLVHAGSDTTLPSLALDPLCMAPTIR